MTEITVRPLAQTDHADWRRLWTAYLTFYETKLPQEVYAITWKRLFTEGEFEPKGFIATLDGKAVGLTHYLYHRSGWSEKNNCYLQDLFADPDAQLRAAEALDAMPVLPGEAMLAGFYVNELVLRLAPRQDPAPELFDAYGLVRSRLATEPSLAWTLRRFERDLLEALGELATQ